MQTKSINIKGIHKLLLYGLCMFLLPSCESNEVLLEKEISPDAMINLSVTKQETITKESEYADAGTYYLGYKENKEPVIKSVEVATGGTVSKTGFYWINVTADEVGKSGATFTLSNVTADGKLKVDGNYKLLNEIANKADILWASDKKWGQVLDFTLQHKMAQVKVTFTVGENITIEKVSLKKMGTGINFDRSKGEVTPLKEDEIFLSKVGESDTYAVLLPPQKRTDDMLLFVQTDRGKFSRTLPVAMSQPIDPSKPDGPREDVPLSFKSGHVLELTAGIKGSQDLTILFTGATLVNWIDKGNAIVPAKPCGIYTAAELNEWAETYNANHEGTNYKLLKYGIYANDKWTFYLRRSIKAKEETTPIDKDFADNLICIVNTYQISGITKEKLFTGTITGNVSNDLFADKTK